MGFSDQLGLIGQKREDRDFVWGEFGMKFEKYSVFLFCVSVNQEKQSRPIHPSRSFNNPRSVFLVRNLVFVSQLMPPQIPVAAVMNPLKLTPTKRCIVLNICRIASVMHEMVFIVILKTQVLSFNSKPFIPVYSLLFPIFKSLFRLFFVRLNKIL